MAAVDELLEEAAQAHELAMVVTPVQASYDLTRYARGLEIEARKLEMLPRKIKQPQRLVWRIS